MRTPTLRVSWLFLFSLALSPLACETIDSVAASGADFGGATADAHCDRRYVTDGGQPSAFCQEIVATVAASQFSDDCRSQHQASAGPGLCPRARIIAGCKLGKKSDDGSVVSDWYYDISDLLPDGGADAAASTASPLFAPPIPHDARMVGALCADRARYEDGAELVYP